MKRSAGCAVFEKGKKKAEKLSLERRVYFGNRVVLKKGIHHEEGRVCICYDMLF